MKEKMHQLRSAGPKTGKILSLLLCTIAAVTACQNHDSTASEEPFMSKSLEVQAGITQPSRAMVTGTAFEDGSSLGASVVDALTGGNYDGATEGYTNIRYTASTDARTGRQVWTSTTPILLSGTEGKAVAYYPFTSAVTDFKAVPVDITTQTDWMYSGYAQSNVSDANPTCSFTMKHALTAVSVKVQRGTSYTGTGAVSALTVTSDGLATNGTFSAVDGQFDTRTIEGAGTAIPILGEAFTLTSGSATATRPYMFVPASAEVKGIGINATIDGKPYQITAGMAEPFVQGKIYNVNVNLSNTGLDVIQVIVTQWDDEDLGDKDFSPVDPWDVPNGVYAVSAEGKPVNVDEADNTCIAVALITDNQRIMIEKNGPANAEWNGNTTLYWGKNLYGKKVAGINETTDTSAAHADFDGKGHTAAIIASYTMHSVDMDARDMCSVLQAFNGGQNNAGFNDWYIPAAGQLYEIYTYKTDINEALTAMDCTEYGENPYWSSSENSDKLAVYLNFFDGGYAGQYVKDNNFRVCFVRDIN